MPREKETAGMKPTEYVIREDSIAKGVFNVMPVYGDQRPIAKGFSGYGWALKWLKSRGFRRTRGGFFAREDS